MDKHKFRELLKRYQDGTANETERALVEAWYESYPQNNRFSLSDNIKTNLLSRIGSVIQPPVVQPKKLWLPYLRIAASVLLVAAIGLISYLHLSKKETIVYTTLQTHAGQIKRLVLPDSSVLWVNASTIVRYPQQFDEKRREIFLDNGEAFFEVVHDAKKPFVVHAQKVNVQVLGTSFNISAYQNLPSIKVMVATGKVGVTQNNKTLALLTPGQELSFDRKAGTSDTHVVDINDIQSWKSGYVDLKQATFAELATVVKNQLGIRLKAGNDKVSGYRFTIRIKQNLPADQTLQLINQIHGTHYRTEGDEIIIY